MGLSVCVCGLWSGGREMKAVVVVVVVCRPMIKRRKRQREGPRWRRKQGGLLILAIMAIIFIMMIKTQEEDGWSAVGLAEEMAWALELAGPCGLRREGGALCMYGCVCGGCEDGMYVFMSA